jgi:hypothetical protein
MSQYETPEKNEPMNEHLNNYDISIAFPFPVVTICKPQTK